MKNILFLLLLCVSSQFLVGQRQSYQGYMTAGDQAVEQNDHYSAYKFYGIAREFPGKENDPSALYKQGESAVKSRAYQIGRDALTRLNGLPEQTEYPQRSFYLAEAFYRLGNYDQAVIYYQKFLADNPTAEEDMRLTAATNINDANWAIDELESERDIPMEHLPINLNSEYSDVAYTVRPDGKAFLTSNRFRFKKDTVNPRRKLSRVMLQDPGQQAKALEEKINLPGKLVAHSAFNGAGDQVYFSVCSYIDYDNIRCDIFIADVDQAGEWNNPRQLEGINGSDYTSQMPNVGADAEDGKEYLYFASNVSGGAGKMDIYRAAIMDDGSVGTALNLESLNTEGNDVTPFFYGPLQTLYYSTDGRKSFGGLDVYKSYRTDRIFRKPVNVGAPVNSSFDDAYYGRFEGDQQAYVSSTRQSPQAIFFDEEKEVCCYDIYRFEPDTRVDLLVTTFNKVNEKALLGATVILYKVGPDGLEPIETIVNPEGNDFAFKLEPGTKYELHASKDGFSTVIDKFDLNDPELSKKPLIERKVYLAPKVDLEVLAFKINDGKPLDGATVGLYRVDENGQEILLEEITNTEGNDFTFPLEYGNLYRVKGTRPGFGPVGTEVDLRGVEPDGTRKITRRLDFGQLLEILVIDGVTEEPLSNATVKLSEVDGRLIGTKTNPVGNDFEFVINLDKELAVFTQRNGYYDSRDTLSFTEADLTAGNGKLRFIIPLFPADVNKLLPLSVYFDNDHPNPRSTSRSTRLAYDETYLPYIERKETFASTYTEGMDEEDAFITSGRFKNFFNLQVEGGWKQLQAFAQQLEQHLKAGNYINLKIQGFASPRAAAEYNRRLSARRIESVINYFSNYNDKALATYIRNKQLTFTKDPRGETADPAVVSDRLNDPRESVFGILASLERKVEISNTALEAGRRK